MTFDNLGGPHPIRERPEEQNHSSQGRRLLLPLDAASAPAREFPAGQPPYRLWICQPNHVSQFLEINLFIYILVVLFLWRTPDEYSPDIVLQSTQNDPFKSHITALVFSNAPRAFISFKEKLKSLSWPAEDPGSSHSCSLGLSLPGLLVAP